MRNIRNLLLIIFILPFLLIGCIESPGQSGDDPSNLEKATPIDDDSPILNEFESQPAGFVPLPSNEDEALDTAYMVTSTEDTAGVATFQIQPNDDLIQGTIITIQSTENWELGKLSDDAPKELFALGVHKIKKVFSHLENSLFPSAHADDIEDLCDNPTISCATVLENGSIVPTALFNEPGEMGDGSEVIKSYVVTAYDPDSGDIIGEVTEYSMPLTTFVNINTANERTLAKDNNNQVYAMSSNGNMVSTKLFKNKFLTNSGNFDSGYSLAKISFLKGSISDMNYDNMNEEFAFISGQTVMTMTVDRYTRSFNLVRNSISFCSKPYCVPNRIKRKRNYQYFSTKTLDGYAMLKGAIYDLNDPTSYLTFHSTAAFNKRYGTPLYFKETLGFDVIDDNHLIIIYNAVPHNGELEVDEDAESVSITDDGTENLKVSTIIALKTPGLPSINKIIASKDKVLHKVRGVQVLKRSSESLDGNLYFTYLTEGKLFFARIATHPVTLKRIIEILPDYTLPVGKLATSMAFNKTNKVLYLLSPGNTDFDGSDTIQVVNLSKIETTAPIINNKIKIAETLFPGKEITLNTKGLEILNIEGSKHEYIITHSRNLKTMLAIPVVLEEGSILDNYYNKVFSEEEE
jgi:hypothetical protein